MNTRTPAVSALRILAAVSAAAITLLLPGVSGFAADVIYLRGGERLEGKIVTDETNRVVIQSLTLGQIEIPRDKIDHIVREGQSAVTDEAKSKPDFLRVYNDDGLRYEFIQPISIYDPFLTQTNFIHENVQITGRFGLKASFDGAAYSSGNGQQHVDSDAEFRALRFYTTGDFGFTHTNSFKLELGLSDGQFYLHEAYVRFPELPYVGNFTFGYIGAPQTMQNLQSFGTLTFMEVASPVEAFGPGNRMALQLDETYLSNRLTATVGFYSVGQDASLNFGDASDSLARPMLRVTGLPIYRPDDKTPTLLHLGGSFSFVYSDTAEIQYRARPESHLAPYLVDTGTINARQAYVFGGEALYLLGPLSFSGEGVASVVLPEAGNSRAFWGAYTEVGWFLTGEQRGYDQSGGFPGRLYPKAPFSFKKRNFGALELATRYSYLDLSAGPNQGGRMTIVMPGLNWYWNQHARWQLNYGFARVVGGPSPGNLNIFQARFQVVF